MATSKQVQTDEQEVAQFLIALKHPLLPLVQALRELIKQAEPALTEHIKWNAPSFCLDGDDRITFNLFKQDAIRIVLHGGAKAKTLGDLRQQVKDPAGLLEWADKNRAVISIGSMETYQKHEMHLQQVFTAWLAATK